MQEVPDDIDGKPPADFPYNQPYSQPSSSSRFWRPPSFRGGPDYYPSPTRRDPRDRYSGYPPSGYQDTGYGRGPESGYPPAAYLPQEYDRRPRPHRREPEAGPRYDAGAGYPPPPYEPEGRYTSPDRGPPPPPPPPTGPPAPRGPPPMEGTPVFPPMPYEPAESPASTGPLAEESAALPQEPPAEVFPPLPYEPEGILLPAFPYYFFFVLSIDRYPNMLLKRLGNSRPVHNCAIWVVVFVPLSACLNSTSESAPVLFKKL